MFHFFKNEILKLFNIHWTGQDYFSMDLKWLLQGSVAERSKALD